MKYNSKVLGKIVKFYFITHIMLKMVLPYFYPVQWRFAC